MTIQVGQGKFKEVKGSVVSTQNAGLRFVLNATNKKCKLEPNEAPLLEELDRKWKNIKGDLKSWYNNPAQHKLGNIRELAVQSDTWIINMLCEDDNLNADSKALKECLKKVADLAKYEQASVHISQKTLDQVAELESLLNDSFIKKNVSVYIYRD